MTTGSPVFEFDARRGVMPGRRMRVVLSDDGVSILAGHPRARKPLRQLGYGDIIRVEARHGLMSNFLVVVPRQGGRIVLKAIEKAAAERALTLIRDRLRAEQG